MVASNYLMFLQFIIKTIPKFIFITNHYILSIHFITNLLIMYFKYLAYFNLGLVKHVFLFKINQTIENWFNLK